MKKHIKPYLFRAGIKPLFDLGEVIVSERAKKALHSFSVSPEELLRRHERGDWGQVEEESKQRNERAAMHGGVVLSLYEYPDHTLVALTAAWGERKTTLSLTGESPNDLLFEFLRQQQGG